MAPHKDMYCVSFELPYALCIGAPGLGISSSGITATLDAPLGSSPAEWDEPAAASSKASKLREHVLDAEAAVSSAKRAKNSGED